MKELYTIDDIATMTMLSTRTIRNYIKQGFLNGEKIDGVWQFTLDKIDEFMKNDFVKQSIKTKRNGLVYDYILNDNKTKNSVCSIYDYPIASSFDAKNLCNNIINKINSNEYEEIKFSYTYEKNMVRIILIGDPEQLTRLMSN